MFEVIFDIIGTFGILTQTTYSDIINRIYYAVDQNTPESENNHFCLKCGLHPIRMTQLIYYY